MATRWMLDMAIAVGVVVLAACLLAAFFELRSRLRKKMAKQARTNLELQELYGNMSANNHRLVG